MNISEFSDRFFNQLEVEVLITSFHDTKMQSLQMLYKYKIVI